MMKQSETKREYEKRVVSQMIHLYCRKHHHTHNGLCEQCHELESYALQRTQRCPYMDSKSFCSNCQTHCYKPAMRQAIREVMRFSGPRMLMYHPVLAIKHLIATKTELKQIQAHNHINEHH